MAVRTSEPGDPAHVLQSLWPGRRARGLRHLASGSRRSAQPPAASVQCQFNCPGGRDCRTGRPAAYASCGGGHHAGADPRGGGDGSPGVVVRAFGVQFPAGALWRTGGPGVRALAAGGTDCATGRRLWPGGVSARVDWLATGQRSAAARAASGFAMNGATPRRYLAPPVRGVAGELAVPGDKSISHRALMLGGIAEGRTEIAGFLASEDCLATLSALRALGVQIERPGECQVRVFGAGRSGLRPAPDRLDMGNAGTAMRLFMGLLAGERFDSTLVGDASLM